MPVVFTSLWTQVFNIDKCPILFLFVRERNVNRKIDTPILLEEKNCSSAWKKQFKNVVFYLFCWNNCSKQFGRNIFILSTCPVLCRIKNCYIRPVIMFKNTVSNNVPIRPSTVHKNATPKSHKTKNFYLQFYDCATSNNLRLLFLSCVACSSLLNTLCYKWINNENVQVDLFWMLQSCSKCQLQAHLDFCIANLEKHCSQKDRLCRKKIIFVVKRLSLS